MDEASLFIQDFAVILLAAALFGWIARSLKQSPIVGYLLAGIFVGTPSVTFPYVSDPARIQVFSQLGLIFLMFSIGLGLRIQRLRELGAKVIIATTLTALIVFDSSRLLSSWIGLGAMEGMFLAAMLTVSSSAIISKTLVDEGLNHTRYGQLGMGMTLLEDIVAVVMLTFLGAMVSSNDSANMLPILGRTVGLVAAFALLIIMIGILLLPRLLHRFVKTGSSELETILLTGLLLGISFTAVKAGYSLALGAFLLGIVIAETSRYAAIRQTFNGFKDVFTTVFFVAIGMSLDISQIGSALPLIAVGTLSCLLLRTLSAWLSLLIAGEPSRIALQTGLVVVPMGEFSFIIAALGVSSGALAPTYAVAAVGISFLTSLVSPSLIAHAPRISNTLHRLEMPRFSRILNLYREFWTRLGQVPDRSLLLRLARKRLIQITVEIIIVTSILVFAQPGFTAVTRLWPLSITPAPWPSVIYGFVVAVLCLGSLVAIWRNIAALAMLIADSISKGNRDLARYALWFQGLFKILAAIALGIWLLNLIPFDRIPWWAILASLAAVGIFLLLLRKKIIRWHSHVEFELQQAVGRNAPSHTAQYLQSAEQWGIKLDEITLPVNTALAGKSIAQAELRTHTGCSIVALERQGYPIHSPGPQTHLFPGDVVLLAGTSENLKKARKMLYDPALFSSDSLHSLHSDVMDVYTLPERSSLIGKSLGELNWSRLSGVQLLGVSREGVRSLFPPRDFMFEVSDTLLLCGSRAALDNLMRDLDATVSS